MIKEKLAYVSASWWTVVGLRKKNRKGFTLIELLISLALMSVIGSLAVSNLGAFSNRRILENQTEKMNSLFENTQDRAVEEENASSWGIKVTNVVSGKDYYEVFYGASYDTGTFDSIHYLPTAVELKDPSVGNNEEIVFTRGTGTTSADFIDISNSTGTDGHRITINSEGLSELITHGYSLAGYWKLDEVVGTTVSDASGALNTGTNVGATINQTGQVDQAYSFVTNDYITILDATDPTVYTIVVWVKPTDVTSVNIFNRTSVAGPTSNWSHQLRITADSKFEHYVDDGSGNTVTGTTTVQAATWYQVVAVAANNGTMKLYVNGDEEGTAGSIGTMITTGDRYYIGSNSGDAMDYFNGIIDDVRIYDRALSGQEIAELYDDSL